MSQMRVVREKVPCGLHCRRSTDTLRDRSEPLHQVRFLLRGLSLLRGDEELTDRCRDVTALVTEGDAMKKIILTIDGKQS